MPRNSKRNIEIGNAIADFHGKLFNHEAKFILNQGLDGLPSYVPARFPKRTRRILPNALTAEVAKALEPARSRLERIGITLHDMGCASLVLVDEASVVRLVNSEFCEAATRELYFALMNLSCHYAPPMTKKQRRELEKED